MSTFSSVPSHQVCAHSGAGPLYRSRPGASQTLPCSSAPGTQQGQEKADEPVVWATESYPQEQTPRRRAGAHQLSPRGSPLGCPAVPTAPVPASPAVPRLGLMGRSLSRTEAAPPPLSSSPGMLGAQGSSCGQSLGASLPSPSSSHILCACINFVSQELK